MLPQRFVTQLCQYADCFLLLYNTCLTNTHSLAPFSVTELYNGCSKKFNITRKRYNSSGELVDDAKCLVINVRPGWKKGTKVSFVNEGDEAPNTIPADLVFVIQEREGSDPGYVREGNNLVYTYRLSLSDALTDHNALQIPTLDQRVISLACPEVVSPFYEKIILGECAGLCCVV